jgi:hypothetical protein
VVSPPANTANGLSMPLVSKAWAYCSKSFATSFLNQEYTMFKKSISIKGFDDEIFQAIEEEHQHYWLNTAQPLSWHHAYE